MNTAAKKRNVSAHRENIHQPQTNEQIMSNKFLTFTASEIQFLRHCPLEQHRDCLFSLYLAAWCPNKQNFCRRRVSCHRFTEVRCERCSNMWDKISLKQRVCCTVQLDSGPAHIETSQHKWWWLLRSYLITLLLSWFSGLELNLVNDERSPSDLTSIHNVRAYIRCFKATR